MPDVLSNDAFFDRLNPPPPPPPIRWASTDYFATPEGTLMQWGEAYYVEKSNDWAVCTTQETSASRQTKHLATGLSAQDALQKLAELQARWSFSPHMCPVKAMKMGGPGHMQVLEQLLDEKVKQADLPPQEAIEMPVSIKQWHDKVPALPAYYRHNVTLPKNWSQAADWRGSFMKYIASYKKKHKVSVQNIKPVEMLAEIIKEDQPSRPNDRLLWGFMDRLRRDEENRSQAFKRSLVCSLNQEILCKGRPQLLAMYMAVREQQPFFQVADFDQLFDRHASPLSAVTMMQTQPWRHPSAQQVEKTMDGFWYMSPEQKSWLVEYDVLNDVFSQQQKTHMLWEIAQDMRPGLERLVPLCVQVGASMNPDEYDRGVGKKSLINEISWAKWSVPMIDMLLAHGHSKPTLWEVDVCLRWQNEDAALYLIDKGALDEMTLGQQQSLLDECARQDSDRVAETIRMRVGTASQTQKQTSRTAKTKRLGLGL